MEQAGFRSNRSCVDQINTLRVIIEQSLEFQSPLYLLFVDYSRAFDSVQRECIWRALEERNLPKKFINLVKEGYNSFQCRVLHNGQLTEPFQTISGARQGCLLSPLLFLVVSDGVLTEMFSKKARGISRRLTQTLEDLDYADDICLLSHKWSDMQEKLNDLNYESKKIGLHTNLAKTEETRINGKSNNTIILENDTIRKVADFNYLGSTVSEDGGAVKVVNIRIQKARGASSRLRIIR
jgi:hypothetical protein